MPEVFCWPGWTLIPCDEAHPGQTCAEYDAWLERLEAESEADDAARL